MAKTTIEKESKKKAPTKKSITDCAISYFKQNNYVFGIEKAVELCGEKLKLHFPIETNDKNELSNTISY